MIHHHHRQTYKPEPEPSAWRIWTGAALALAAIYAFILVSVLWS